MRTLGLIAMAGVALAAMSPAYAEWKQYQDKSLGIFNSFPVPPTRTEEIYKGPARNSLAKSAKSVVLTAVDEDVTYKVQVIDFTKRAGEGSNLAGEAINMLVGGRGADFQVTDFPLWDKGANAVYGTAIIIDKKDDAKTHILADVVFNKGKLYIITASVPGDSPSRNSPGLARFMDTAQFHMEGYGFNYATGHDYPIGDNDPNDRDNAAARPNYKPPEGAVSGPIPDEPGTVVALTPVKKKKGAN
jgi:hypothetical protein